MSSAYGSWEQWRERREKMGEVLTAIDSQPPPDGDPWDTLHAWPGANVINSVSGKAAQQAVAERRAG